MKEGYSNWRKLDNAALAFPLVTGKNDTRVFRFYCELKENVKPELLQAALEKTMEKYPLFQMVLRKGLFWFYLEHRDIRPIVKEEKKPPCSRLKDGLSPCRIPPVISVCTSPVSVFSKSFTASRSLPVSAP